LTSILARYLFASPAWPPGFNDREHPRDGLEAGVLPTKYGHYKHPIPFDPPPAYFANSQHYRVTRIFGWSGRLITKSSEELLLSAVKAKINSPLKPPHKNRHCIILNP
jgi:hypothetical protein